MRRSRFVNHAPPAGRAARVVMLMALICTAAGVGPDVAPSETPDLARADVATYVRTTDSFVVRGHNEPLVALLASRAEQTLARLRRRRLAPPEPTTPITITVHRSREAYRTAVGADLADTDAHVAIRRGDDGSLERTIHLTRRTDTGTFDTRLIARILPHEIAHAALETRFVTTPAPLYLQEGLAVAAESDNHRTAIVEVGLAVAEGRDVPLQDLVRRREVNAEAAPLFYAQSYSFVTYLRRQMSDRQFDRFLDELARGRPTFGALRRALRVGTDAFSVAKLQQAWRDDAVRQAALAASSAPASRPTSQPADTD
ncbi:MAG: hypothetical protein ACOC7R_04985 [Planctomycetota bacterium]